MNSAEEGCLERIARELAALGVRPADTIMVHASCKALGPVPGGIETVVQGLLRALGPQGTLLLPALNWELRPPMIFDPRTSRSIVGAIPEYFRTRPGTLRSIHPTHSVCGVGARAKEWLEAHEQDHTPCGPLSPFHRLLEEGGRIVMLGCGLRPNTTMHALEEYVVPPYLFGAPVVYSLRGWDGITRQKEYVKHNFAQKTQRYDRVAGLSDTSFLRSGRVLEAETFVLDAPGLKKAVLPKLKEAPLYFVDSI